MNTPILGTLRFPGTHQRRVSRAPAPPRRPRWPPSRKARCGWNRRCYGSPERALHANLAWLPPVHQEFGTPKDQLWQQHGPGWTATLADAGGRTSSFRLRYRCLAATSPAIITVADEPKPLSAPRRDLLPLLRLPGSASAGGLGAHDPVSATPARFI